MTTLNVCRLCLEIIPQNQRYEYLKYEDLRKEKPFFGQNGLVYTHMLKASLPEINIELTEAPLVCNNCTNKLMTADLFRYRLSEIEQKILALKINSENLRNIRELVVFKSVKRPRPVCRTCLTLTSKVKPLYYTSTFDYSYLLMMLKDCYPNMNLALTAQPSICHNCIGSLEKFYAFRHTCLEKELIIKDYITQYNIETEKISLINVLQNIPPESYSLNNDCNKITIKEEILEENSSLLPYCDIKIETLNEDVNIKEENEENINFTDPDNIKTENLFGSDPEGFHFLASSIFPSTSSNVTEGKQRVEESSSALEPVKSKTCLKCIDTTSKCTHEDKKTVDWYKCELCNYQTHWKHHINRHKQIHDKESTSDKMYHCKLCPFESKFKHSIIRHNALDHADSYKCSKCSFTTKFKFGLSEHEKEVHNQLEVWHKCAECPYATKWKYHLKRHMVKHSK